MQLGQALSSSSAERRYDLANKSSERLIDCPASALERIDGQLHTVFPYGVATATVFGTSYTYVNLTIDTNHCLYLLEPDPRRLSADEARDFLTALMVTPPPSMEFVAAPESTVEGSAGRDLFDELLNVAKRKLTLADDLSKRSALFGAERLVDCSSAPPTQLASTRGDHLLRFIYNGSYSWKEAEFENGLCIFIFAPLNRGLTIPEAQSFLAANRLDLGVSPEYQRDFGTAVDQTGRIPEVAASADMDAATPVNILGGFDSPGLRQKGDAEAKSGDATNSVPFNNPNFPYNSLTLTHHGSTNIDLGTRASAVQVSPYVYMTAAHVVAAANGSPYTDLEVYPAYNLPSHTSPIASVGVVIDPAWVSADANHKAGHDIAFIHVNTSRTPVGGFPQIFVIDETADTGWLDSYIYCGDLDPGNDPYSFSVPGVANWLSFYYNLPTADCPAATRTLLGYPDASNPNHVPYASSPFLQGNFTGGVYYELVHWCPDCVPVNGLEYSYISPGSSGGPLFMKPPTIRTDDWVIVGLATEIPPSTAWDGWATGAFRYNWGWMAGNRNWSPSNPVIITSPTDGGVYDVLAVPNLRVNAGSQTSQVQWSSNIDGSLGTGDNVVVAGRLSPGSQVITATLPGTAVESNKVIDAITSVVRTVHITVTGNLPPPQPYVYVSPKPVVIPYGQATANAHVSWTSVCEGSCDNWRTDISYRLNGGAYVYWKEDVPAGSDVFPLHAGDAVTFYAYQHHFDESAGHTDSVNAVQGAQPTLSIVPTPVVVPAGQSSGTYSMSWTAPGYPSVDLWARFNNTGAWSGPVGAQPNSSYGDNLTVPNRVTWRTYAPGSAGPNSAQPSTGLLKEATTYAAQGAQPTFSISPVPVVVPAGQTSGSYSMSWTAPGYPSVDLWGRFNNTGAWSGPVGAQPNSSYGDNLASPNRVTWRTYAPGSAGPNSAQPNTGFMKEVTTYTTQGAQPTFTITPTHIIVPAGQTSGTYSMSWTAPGYPSVDLWGRFNNTGAWSGPVGAQPNSSYGDNLTVPNRVTWRTYAPGSAGPNSSQPNNGFFKEVTTYASH
jgi:hypothetical protein